MEMTTFELRQHNQHPEQAGCLHTFEAGLGKKGAVSEIHGTEPKPGYFFATNLCHYVMGHN